MFRAVFLTGIHLLLFDMIHMKIRQNGISIAAVLLAAPAIYKSLTNAKHYPTRMPPHLLQQYGEGWDES